MFPTHILPILFIGVLLLTSCVQQTTPLPPLSVDQQQHQQQLAQLQSWQLEGKIAIKHAGKSDSATIRWQQLKDRYDIFLSGPLGVGATRLYGTSKSLLIATHDGQQADTHDPEAFLEAHLGWTLPLSQLPKWVTGACTVRNCSFNPDNTLSQLAEQGWQVQFERYQAVGDRRLPEKLVLMHDDLQVTLVIKHWELH